MLTSLIHIRLRCTSLLYTFDDKRSLLRHRHKDIGQLVGGGGGIVRPQKLMRQGRRAADRDRQHALRLEGVAESVAKPDRIHNLEVGIRQRAEAGGGWAFLVEGIICPAQAAVLHSAVE